MAKSLLAYSHPAHPSPFPTLLRSFAWPHFTIPQEAEENVMDVPPRDTEADRLVSGALLRYSYAIAGLIQAGICTIGFFSIFWWGGVTEITAVQLEHLSSVTPYDCATEVGKPPQIDAVLPWQGAASRTALSPHLA